MDGEAGSEKGPAADAAALERVRRDLAHLGNDPGSAPDVPPEVVSRVVGALRREPGHSLARPRLSRMHLVGLIVGTAAVLVAAVVSVTMLAGGPTHTYSRGPTAQEITVSRPASGIPLADSEIVALLSRAPDYGPLADPRRRTSCLDGLGYPPATHVLGARLLTMRGTPAVLLLLPGTKPGVVVAVSVEPACNAAHTGLLAKTEVTRP
jgi:hypothetical protein